MSSFITNERLLRFIEDGNIKDALYEPLQPPLSREEKLRQLYGKVATQDNAISSVTLGKFLYDYLRIDPRVVEGIDFASKEQFDNLFQFAQFANKTMEDGVFRDAGVLERLKGYVGEQFAAWTLQAQGHEIGWPSTSNNPGWDILLDGTPFQIKCVTNPSLVREHLAKYPHIPVIVNKEMAPHFADEKTVHALSTLSEKEVMDATRDTLQHGKNLTNFEIPWISLAIISSATIKNLILGNTDLQGAVTTVVIDFASINGASFAGREVLSYAGLILLGPYGAVMGSIIGQIVGARAGRPISNELKQAFLKDQIASIYWGVSAVLTQAAREIDRKIDCKEEKEHLLDESIRHTKANSYVKGTVKENFEEDRRYLKNKKREMLSFARDPRGTFDDPLKAIEHACVITAQAGVHPQCTLTQWEHLSGALGDFEKQCLRYGIKH